ncbi:hypothetical protein L7F22_041510 [Adiantum nelumboides]|nr:hypothetical protein [Adiantum nelumboides]
MVFVKDSPSFNDVSRNGSLKVDNDLHSFLNEHAELFINDIPSELPPKRKDDDHRIDLIRGSSPPNKPPYRVSQAQQEEIMSQVNELVQKEHLKAVFQALQENKMYINCKKSEFFLEEIQYLGHIIYKDEIRMDPQKLEVINAWPEPRNLHELQSFIGMCACYRRFIAKFSAIAGPLHDLTKKNVKYVWTNKERKDFTTLKERLMFQPVLVLPDLSKPFEVNCDASGYCLGAVLLQEGHAIAYESRQLHYDEQSLGIYEKELLTVMHAFNTWKHYLLGTPFMIRMDHQSLKNFMPQTNIFDKQLRWANFLLQFHFHIAHIPGKQNHVANALSRRPYCNAVSVASHNDLTSMVDEYATYLDFCDVMSVIALGKMQEPCVAQDGYLLYGSSRFLFLIHHGRV